MKNGSTSNLNPIHASLPSLPLIPHPPRSLPQHCASLLARVAQCRLRHPQWRAEALFDAVSGAGAQVDEGLLSASLKDIQEMSLRLSVDGK